MEIANLKKDCVTSTQAEFWVIVNYRHSDPGSEFEIIHESQIHGNSWETLDTGSEITIKFGNAKAQGEIVMISDDFKYLQENFKIFTEDYARNLEDCRSPSPTVSSKSSTKSKRSEVYEFHTIQKTIIKVCDRETQTTPFSEGEEFKNKYELLQSKYNNLLKVFDGLKDNFKRATNLVHLMKCGDDNMSPTVPLTLQPMNDNLLKETPSRNTKKDSSKKLSVTKKEVFEEIDEDGEIVLIGYNKTPVPKHIYSEINWSSYTGATRKLLMTLFPRTTLATHSLTGKPSHAFAGVEKQRKMKLDTLKINDVVDVVSRKCYVSESLVRSAITTKCADENKMYKKRLQKKTEEESNKENAPNCCPPTKKTKFS